MLVDFLGFLWSRLIRPSGIRKKTTVIKITRVIDLILFEKIFEVSAKEGNNLVSFQGLAIALKEIVLNILPPTQNSAVFSYKGRLIHINGNSVFVDLLCVNQVTWKTDLKKVVLKTCVLITYNSVTVDFLANVLTERHNY